MSFQEFAAFLEPSLHIGSSFDIGIDNGVWRNFSKKMASWKVAGDSLIFPP